MTATNLFDMTRVAELLRTLHGLPSAYVEHTGGGIATIYAGNVHTDGEGETRYAALGGPGVYRDRQVDADRAVTYAEGDLRDFYIGADDDGEAVPLATETLLASGLLSSLSGANETEVAILIAAQARQPLKRDGKTGKRNDHLTLADAEEALKAAPPVAATVPPVDGA